MQRRPLQGAWASQVVCSLACLQQGKLEEAQAALDCIRRQTADESAMDLPSMLQRQAAQVGHFKWVFTSFALMLCLTYMIASIDIVCFFMLEDKCMLSGGCISDERLPGQVAVKQYSLG